MLEKLHPRRWHLMTWSIFLVWLLFGTASNFPWKATEDSFPEFPADAKVEPGTTIADFSMRLIGWPLFYLEQTKSSQSTTITSNTRWEYLISNIAIIIVVQVSIVITFQRFGQFTVRSMFAATLIVAILISLAISIQPFAASFYFKLLVYHFPILTALVSLHMITKSRSAKTPASEATS
jgi:hypothetical protein